jgi:hypothetical protein
VIWKSSGLSSAFKKQRKKRRKEEKGDGKDRKEGQRGVNGRKKDVKIGCEVWEMCAISRDLVNQCR